MSLQEEIAKELKDECFVEAEHDDGEAWGYCKLRSESLINKVLDAAVEAVKTTKGVVSADDALWVINKLREGE